MFVEALGGRRYVSVSRLGTKKDRAREVKSVVTEQYPQAEKVVLVMDNLNTYTLSSLYEAFPAEEAFELAQKLEIHYTPKHGSWLNIAETELSEMTSQCLARRIDTLEKLLGELKAWQWTTKQKAEAGGVVIYGRRCPDKTSQIISIPLVQATSYCSVLYS
jgi:hypothetical protein